MRTFESTDITYRAIMETGCECTFGKVGPTELRCGEEVWRRLMHKLIDICDPRLPLVVGFICSTAKVVFDPTVPNNAIDFYVPQDNEKYGARLELGSCSHEWQRRRDGRWCSECGHVEFGV